MVLELGSRVMRMGPAGLVHWSNLAREHMRNSEDGAASCAYAFDPDVGWILPPGCTSPGYNVDADGFRKASTDDQGLARPPVLVTGSSFAKGDEVDDDQAWPAYLQGLIGRRVLNVGASGYSLDQTVLRTEKLVPRVKPLFVIASFTPDDIRRNELKAAWSREKPYFTVADDRLELHNVPVPGHRDAPVPLPLAARLLGWSALADIVAERLNIFVGWYYDEVRGAPEGSGGTISCLLMQRLAGLGMPVVVMAEYPRSHWMADAEGKARDFAKTGPVLACAARAGLIPLDMSEPLKPAIDAQGLDALFRSEHHSPEGNRATAEAVLQDLVRHRLLTQTADR